MCIRGAPSSSCPSYTEMMRQMTLPTVNIPSTAPYVQQFWDQGAFPLLSSQPTYYFDPSNGSSVAMRMMIPSVTHQLRTDNFATTSSHDDKR